jgi:hypothetical protein
MCSPHLRREAPKVQVAIARNDNVIRNLDEPSPCGIMDQIAKIYSSFIRIFLTSLVGRK